MVPTAGSVGRFLRWKLSRRASPELPDPRDEPVTPVRPEPRLLARPRAPVQVTWLGHASVLIQVDGVTVVTDPLFGHVAGGAVRRLSRAPLSPDELPAVDVITVSHNHFDHLDLRSLRALRRRFPEAPVLVPSGLAPWMRRRVGDPVRSLEWWEGHEVRGVTVTSVPAQHWSVRLPGDRMQTHWCGWVVRGPSGSAYFAGDTGFGPCFEAIQESLGAVDVAALPIGAYAPRWFMLDQHMAPEEAVRAAAILRARVLVPVHFGTFRLSDEPLDEPPRLVSQVAREAGVHAIVLRPGGTLADGRVHGAWDPP